MDAERTRIVFVTGASRSGTTMLSRVLGNHSQIRGLRELHFFGDLFGSADSGPLEQAELERLAATVFSRQDREVWGTEPTELERRRATTLCERLAPAQRTGYGVFDAALASLAADTGKQITCEQTPRNIFYAANILGSLPDARVVHIVRDPRAVLASQKNRWKLRKLGAKHVPLHETIRTWVNYHPVTMAKLWITATNAALRLSDHPRFKLVRFEDLVASPEVQVRELCEFLQVPFEPEMILVPRWGSSNVKSDTGEKGLSKEVLDQWQTILTDGELRIVERMAAGLLKRFAYPPRSQGRFRTSSLLRQTLSYPFHLAGVALTNPRRAWIQARAILRSPR
jgi:hypothetical protein